MNEVHHTTERFLFEDLQGKKIEADFDGGKVSSDAGLLLLREVGILLDIDDTEDTTHGHQ